MKALDALARALLLLVGVWLILPWLRDTLGSVLPMIGTLFVLVVVVRIILGRASKP